MEDFPKHGQLCTCTNATTAVPLPPLSIPASQCETLSKTANSAVQASAVNFASKDAQ